MRGSPWRYRAAWVVVGVLGAIGDARAAPSALDKPAFTAAPSELLALAKAAPTGAWSYAVLREELDVRYDDRGRATTRVRLIIHVQTEDAFDRWERVNAFWRSQHQARPSIRARVIAPSGAVASIDPSRLTDAAVDHGATTGPSDRWNTSIQLPLLQVGSVIEQEIVLVDREPALGIPGHARRFLGNAGPTQSTVVSFSAPASQKVHRVERKLPPGARVRRDRANGREHWRYEIDALPPVHYEDDVPGDVIAFPYVGISAAPSWNAVARRYRALVDQQIAAGALAWPAELPRAASLAAVEAVTAWVHRKVTDERIGLESAGFLPSPPAEVVRRGAGTGADRATLLVALLRQAGLRAELALVYSSHSLDVDPELPGITMFDHPLVRVRIDGRDRWIDLTSRLSPVGITPAYAQGRRALVIADDTTGLVVTPRLSSADNVIRELRSYTASEAGGAALVEVVSASGLEGVARREAYVEREPDGQAAWYRELVTGKYAGTFERVTATDPRALGAPFTTTVEVANTSRVFAERERIVIRLYPSSVLAEVPSDIVHADAASPARVHDYVWPVPHVFETEHKIVLPTGYTMPALTPDRTRQIGTATFSERRRVDGQTLTVTFRFDSGKPRLTASELTALQIAIASLRDEVIEIAADHTGYALANAGKSREAVAECRRLIALHPEEALHHSQLAMVLLRAGAGEAARRTARAAVALAPDDADPLTVLGWALRHDSLGRPFVYDWDRAGSIAAYRRALALDPSHMGGAMGLAQVLERDDHGRWFVPTADVHGAAEAWRAAHTLYGDDDNALSLAIALFWDGRWAEAEALLRGLPASGDRDRFIVASVAVQRDAEAAIDAARDLRRLVDRGPLIREAALLLVRMRRYELARAVHADLGLPPERRFIPGLAQHPAIPSDANGPTGAALDVVMALFDHERATKVFWDPGVGAELRSSLWLSLEPALMDDPRTLSDAVRSLAVPELQRAKVPGVARVLVPWRHVSSESLYFVNERGLAKLVGGDQFPEGLGRYALRVTDATSEARARELLDWLYRQGKAHETKGERLERFEAFKLLWVPGSAPTRSAIQLAGAALAGPSDAERAGRVLARCASTLPDAQAVCHRRLVHVYRSQQRWVDVLAELDAIARLPADPRPAVIDDDYLRAEALVALGRRDEADRQLDELLAKQPQHHAVVLRLVNALGREAGGAKGAIAAALRSADGAINDDRGTSNDNNVAWFRLIVGEDVARAHELAIRATKSDASAAALNTRAAIEAELGDVGAAVATIGEAMNQRRSVVPTECDWYVYGRVYEQLGLASDAIAAYKRLKTVNRDPMACYPVAARRLAALGGNKPK